MIKNDQFQQYRAILMIPDEIVQKIEEIRFNFESVQISLEFRRYKESLQIIPLLYDQMLALDGLIASKETLKGQTNRPFLSSAHGHVIDVIKAWGPNYLKVSQEEIDKLNYTHFIKSLEEIFGKQVNTLKKLSTTAAEKQFIKNCIIGGVAVMLIVLAGFLVHKALLMGKGLKVEYYRGTNFDEIIDVGLSHKIDYGSYSAMSRKLPPVRYSARWTGYLIVPKDGKYVFSFFRDDGLRFYIDDTLLIDKWNDGHELVKSEEINLAEGLHKIRIDYYQFLGDAVFQFYWKENGQPSTIVSEKYLRPVASGYQYARIKGQGLKAEFYGNTHFEDLIDTGVSPKINFDNHLQMSPKLPMINFSARWTGSLLIPKNGNYVFSFFRDDGLRFYLDDQLLIDDWREAHELTSTKEIEMTAGPHKIKIEFGQFLGGASLKFYWKEGSHNKEIVPAEYLRPT